MCKPPELGPGPIENAVVEVFVDEGSEWEGDASLASPPYASILGKRALEDTLESSFTSSQVKSSKINVPIPPALNSAAASFMSQMEQCMLERCQRQLLQQQQLRYKRPEMLQETGSATEEMRQLLLMAQDRAFAASGSPVFPGVLTGDQKLQQQQQLQQEQMLLLLKPRRVEQLNSRMLFSPAIPASSTSAPPSTQGKVQGWLQATAHEAAVNGAIPAPCDTVCLPMLGDILHPANNWASGALDELKKAKRMISNRASAKRSRQKKRAKLDELDKVATSLQDENSRLAEDLEDAQQHIAELKEKNMSLSEEVSTLRSMLGLNDPSISTQANSCAADTPTVNCTADTVKEEVDEWAADALEDRWELKLLEDLGGECTMNVPDNGLPHASGLPQEMFSELLACLDG